MKKFISNVILLVCLVGVGKVWGQVYVLNNATEYSDDNLNKSFSLTSGKPLGELRFEASTYCAGLAGGPRTVSVQQTVDGVESAIIYTTEDLYYNWGHFYTFNNLSRNATQIRFTSAGGCAQYIRNVSIKMASYLESATTSINDFSVSNAILEKTFDVSHSNTAAISVTSNSPNFTVISPTATFGGSGLWGTQTIKIKYTPQDINNHSGVIKISDGIKTTNVNVQGTSIVAPSNVRSTSQAYVSLGFAWDAVTNATSYDYELLQNSVVVTSGTTTTTDKILSNLTPNTSYQFQVKANFAANSSGFTLPIASSTLNMTPQNIQTSAVTEQSLIASWDAVADVEGYEINIYKSSDNSVVKTDRITALNYTVTGLTRGTNYYYTVSAFVGSVVSQPSSRVNVMTAVSLPISITQATGINYEWLTNNNTNATWTTAEESGYELQQSSASVVVKFNDIPLSANIKLYRTRNSLTCYSAFPNMYIETSTDGSTWTIIKDLPQDSPTGSASRVNEYTDLSLSADVRQLRISRKAATGSCLSIELTDGHSFLRELTINPVTITALAATDIEGNSFTANWQPVANATDYAVSVYQKNGSNIIPVATLSSSVDSVIVSGLTPYQTYYYQVRAVFPSGQTQPSNEIKVITLAVPTVGEATEITQTTFTANWSEVSGVTGYYVTVYNADHSIAVGRQQVPGVGTTSVNIVNLTAGSTYYYTVECYVNISVTEEVTSLPVRSTEFTTTVSEENSGLALPYTIPADITFAGNKEVIYEFSGVAGQFIFTTTQGGTYNSLNPNQFRIYESADKTTWRLLKTYGHGQFDNTNAVVDLSKTTRYVKLAFTKTWSCDATITLKSVSKITKALTVTPTVLTDFSDANEVLTQDFIIHYSNIKTPLTVIPSAHFSVAPSTITPDASGTGSATVAVTFNPNAVTTYNEQIKVEDSNYTTNFVTINVSGQSRIQSAKGLTAQNSTFTSMDLSWDDVSADEYFLTVKEKNTSTVILNKHALSGSTLTYALTNLSPSTVYVIELQVKFGSHTSAPAHIEQSTLNNIPEVLGAEEVTGTSFKATWKSLTGITGYYVDVYRVSDNTQMYGDLQTLGTDLEISSLNPGITYYYTVRSYLNIEGSPDPLTSLPARSEDFTTLVTEDNGNVLLPYTVPANIVFSDSKDVKYKFSTVPGTFTFSLLQNSGSGNQLNPNSLTIYESPDGTTWHQKVQYLALFYSQFNQPNVILNLDKTTRYLKVSFVKTWSCDAQVTLTGAVITKALLATPDALSGFSDTQDNMIKKTFAVNYSNVNEVLTVTAPAGFTVSPSEITAAGTGSANVEVTFKPTTANSYSGQVRVERKDYPEDFTTVKVSGLARMQPVTNFKRTAIDLTSITLVWDDVHADEYLLTVVKKETLETVFTQTFEKTQTTFKVENLLSNTSYTLSIKAKFGAKYSTETTFEDKTKDVTDLPQPVEITTKPIISQDLRHNMTLSEVILSGGLATDGYGNTVEGTFTFKEPATVLQQGSRELVVVFQPVATADFVSTEFTIVAEVLKGLQTIVWADKESLSELKLDAMAPLTATATSGLLVNYISSNTEIAEVVDEYLVVKSAGTITLTAEQSGNADFEAAESMTQNITIQPKNTDGDGGDDNPTSVSQPVHINIYPNPVKSMLFISGFEIESVELLSIQGQKVLHQTFGQTVTDVTLDISTLAAGLYFVKGVSGSQTFIRTITITK